MTTLLLLLFYFSCYWHDCMSCIQTRQQESADCQFTAAEAYQWTLNKEQYLKQQGYEVCTVWEHEIRRQLEQDKDMQAFFDDAVILMPIAG